ncbi:PLP-dependent cysteine synthase family protein [Tessaracoccus sp. MC1865]|uniref:PLP-dependent cysteine synthase family protein n=1 Tax=Tessaracoccus sp. MC1865 TaxID=2760310 RepID=UPI0015FFC94A|nr:PLP-dependent cysteine synthase family protein [Tessaracoccus sp. MC1865]MBB1483929.1 PLP-dependent cysteine synthase family protein [Tessaracoccus sp. MC1865]QTO36978.1 PLP-dependent cysteine synthase family protein [Tessaracoccus sp. MC1865]
MTPGQDIDRSDAVDRAWVHEAIRKVEADANRSADTHLLRLPQRAYPGVDIYLKDESTHPTGSLKHRLARSLFLFALCNGQIHEHTTVIESSSGSTAVSEAYFARLLGLKFIAVIPRSTSEEKIGLIERAGGTCHLVNDPTAISDEAARLASETGGHYLDQFTHAERVTDWRGNNNIAESIFCQLELERHPIPTWVVVSAGTGGTAATIGRYVRYRRHATRLAVADPDFSAFLPGWRDGDPGVHTDRGSRIEGIGRSRVEPSFVPGVVDRMIAVPDGASVAMAQAVAGVLGRTVGPSTGTNLWAALQIARQMHEAGENGSIVSLICDSGERYAATYGHDSWLAEHGIDPAPHRQQAEDLLGQSGPA